MRWTIGLALGLILALGLSNTVAAAVLVKEKNPHGAYGVTDENSSPGGTCGYSGADSNGIAYLRWIKLFPPNVLARDIGPGADHQKVSWQFTVQRSVNSGPWQAVAHSATQSATAYDTAGARFSPIKTPVNGTDYNQQFRAIETIKWFRAGSVEGLVKLRIEFYGVKWTVGSPDFVWKDGCGGAAD